MYSKIIKDVGGIQGLCVLEPKIFEDERGYFLESYNDLELQNFDYLAQIDTKIINMICKSSSRRKIKGISIASSKYVEGRILARADKKVSINNFKNTSIKSKIALLTGKNKELNKK